MSSRIFLSTEINIYWVQLKFDELVPVSFDLQKNSFVPAIMGFLISRAGKLSEGKFIFIRLRSHP